MELDPATLLTAVPNLSDGADHASLAAVGAAFEQSGSARLLAPPHSDPDHGRTVFTLAAEPGQLAAALVDGAGAALARFDLRTHAGSHPIVGVVDVVPVVFLDEQRREAAISEASVTAELLASELAVPVFLYGALADGRTRAELRRGGLTELTARIVRGELAPDFGPTEIDPAKGVTLVAARPPLVAFNLELAPPSNLADAKAIAAALREGLSAAISRLEEPMNVMASAVAVLQRRDPSSAAILQQALSASRDHMEALRQVIPQCQPEHLVRLNLNEILRRP